MMASGDCEPYRTGLIQHVRRDCAEFEVIVHRYLREHFVEPEA